MANDDIKKMANDIVNLVKKDKEDTTLKTDYEWYEMINECGLCHNNFEGFGNNPLPFKVKRCCDNCNVNKVIPARIMLLMSQKNKSKK